MKSSVLEPNQHLNREQVLKTFEALDYSSENIVSTVNIEGFIETEIFSLEALNQAIQDVIGKAGDKNNRLILFRVGEESRGFVANEGENNHYVALHFAEEGSNLKLTYIDPTGTEISPQISEVKTSNPSLVGCTIASSQTSLQFTMPVKGYGIPYQMGGNDSDCGVLVALAADMVRRNHEGRDEVRLSESLSRRLGQALRQLTNGEKRIDDIGQVIGRILDEGKVRVGATSQDSELDNALDNLLLAFSLPKTFKEFRDLGETRKIELSKAGIDGKSARNYKPDAAKKVLMTKLIDSIEEENKENELFYVGNIPSILERKLINKYQQQIDLDKTFFKSKITPVCMEVLQHLAAENQTVKAKERVLNLAKAKQIMLTDIQENPSKGANQSFTAIVNGKNYYIKTCSDDAVLASSGKVDPNELFVYKVMEYMGFGPKTEFLFGRYSSAAGRSSISRGNYIMTEDLNQNGNRLLLDTEENHGAFQEALAVDRQFAVEISAASALNDILSLTDTFGRNVRNYGLLIRSDGSRMIQFVDHLPNANNGLFSLIDFDPTTYSPRDYLQRKSGLGLKSDEHSAFKDLEDNRSSFQRMIIQRDVNSRLSGLEEAIKQAEFDVRSLMRPETYGENFIEEAGARMTRYMEKIGRNKATYERTIPQATQEGR